MGIVTSSITCPAEKKLRMGRQFSQINGEFAKHMRKKNLTKEISRGVL